jgi:hypothetical protein
MPTENNRQETKGDSSSTDATSTTPPQVKERAVSYGSFPAGESSLPSYFELLAAKVERDPAVLQIALENIARWRRDGHSAPHRLDEWRSLITASQSNAAGRQELLRLLRATDTASVRLKEFNPFAGLLTREERRQARELCGYRH